jgi:tetratricopeptide (TPR) repeat protein
MKFDRSFLTPEARRVKRFSKNPAQEEKLQSLLRSAKNGAESEMYQFALESKRNEDFITAKKWFKKVVAREGNYLGEAWNGLGTLAWEQKNYVEALRCFRIAGENGLAVAIHNSGVILEKNMNDVEGAMDAFHKAKDCGYEKSAGRIKALNSRLLEESKKDYAKGLEAEKRGDTASAKYHFLRATTVENTYAAKAWNGLGNIAWRTQRDFDAALEYYGRASSLGLAIASYNFGQVVKSSGNNYENALAWFRHALAGGYLKAEARIKEIEGLQNKAKLDQQRQYASQKFNEGLSAQSKHI